MFAKLKRPSLASFIGAAIIFLVQVILVAYLMQPDFITKIDESYIIDNPGQDTIHTVYKVAKIRREYAPEATKVYILGGSSVRDSYDDEVLSEMLSERTGRVVKYASFGNYSQDLFDSYILAASLPKDERTIVIVSLNINRFRPASRLDVNDRHNILTIPFVWRYAREGLELLPGFDRNYYKITTWDIVKYIRVRVSFRLQTAVRNAVAKARTGDLIAALKEISYLWSKLSHNRYNQAPESKFISKDRLVKINEDILVPAFIENKQANYEMIDNLISLISSAEARTVLFLGPMSPLALKAYEPIMPVMIDDLTGMVQRPEARVSVLTSEKIYPSDDDFYDLVHLNEEGRQQTIDAFADQVALIIKQN